jgi:hypothetical protein
MRIGTGVAIIVVAWSGLALAQSAPTGSELLKLRAACAETGKRFLLGAVIVPPLTKTQTTYYDAKSNRCYVDLTVRGPDYINRNLFDGQSNELLAIARIETSKKIGMIIDGEHGSLKSAPWDAATAYIDAKMPNEHGKKK